MQWITRPVNTFGYWMWYGVSTLRTCATLYETHSLTVSDEKSWNVHDPADDFSFLPFKKRCLYGTHKTRQGIRQSASTDRLATCKKTVRTHPRKTARLSTAYEQSVHEQPVETKTLFANPRPQYFQSFLEAFLSGLVHTLRVFHP